MKFIRQLLAALLLVIMLIACDQKEKRTSSAITLTDIKVEEQKKPQAPLPPPNQQAQTDYQRSVIVRDENVSIGMLSQEGIKDEGLAPMEEQKEQQKEHEVNAEEYDNIV